MDEEKRSDKTQKIKFLGTSKHMRRGLSFFKDGEYRHAIEQFELILLHDKNCVRAYNNLGYVHYTIGDFDRALEVWEQGLKVDSSYRRLQKNVAEVRQQLKQQGADLKRISPGIENFVEDIEWLSKNAELVEVRESRFFETYLIEDLHSRYALKTIRRTLPSTAAAARSFEQACSDWLQLLVSKHVVAARSLEKVAAIPFLAVEYAPEGSLRDLLETGWAIASPEYAGASGSRKMLSVPQILELAVHICAGLHMIHTSTGRSHGDVRPENMLLYTVVPAGVEGTKASEASEHILLKITNVGLWAVFKQKESFCAPTGRVIPELAAEGLVLTPSGFMTSSLSWCAPELIDHIDSPTIATDVYAFGVVLYEMLTGLLPFSGSTPSELLRNMKEDRPTHPSIVNTRIPHVIGNVAMRCLETKPEARFEDFFEIGDALIQYLTASQSALQELSKLCKRYRKISKLQFREEGSGKEIMIVGGTEFSSEIGQIWEILRQSSEKRGDSELSREIARIEEALSLPGFSIGELYPSFASIAEALTMTPGEHYSSFASIAGALTMTAPEKYRDLLKSFNAEEREASFGGEPTMEDTVLEVTVEPRETPFVGSGKEKAISTAEVFGPDAAEKYSSLLILNDSIQAGRLLSRAVRVRTEMVLAQASGSSNLLEAFGEIARSPKFDSFLEPMFEELPETCDCPDPRDFLENGMETQQEIIAAFAGLLFMISDRYSEAQETFNLMAESRYLQALNICFWALAKFQSPEMKTIRRNSLKSAAGLLKESILADKESGKKSTIIISSRPGSAQVDSFFLRGLIFEQLGEHKLAIANFRECKKKLLISRKPYPNVRPWANLTQGKSLYELGMPSEAFLRWKRVLIQELRSPSFSFLDLGISKPRTLIAKHILRCCEAALSRFVDNSLLWCVKSKLLNCVGHVEEAIECALRAITIKTGFAPAHFVRMEALMSTERLAEAHEALRECALREPNEPMFMLREAELLCRLGETRKALREVKNAIARGLDLWELEGSIRNKRLAALEQSREFIEIMEDLKSL